MTAVRKQQHCLYLNEMNWKNFHIKEGEAAELYYVIAMDQL